MKFLKWKRERVQVVKHPVESVWFGIEPLIILSQILGYWAQVLFQKPDLALAAFQKPNYVSKSWLIIRTIYYLVLLTISLYLHSVNILGEMNNDHKTSAFAKLSYLVAYAYILNNIVSVLLSLAAAPKLVEFLNNIAKLDGQLQIQPEDCKALRRRSWMLTILIVVSIAANIGVSSVNFQWWGRAGGSIVTAYLGVIFTPMYMFYSVTLLFLLVQLMNTLGHRFQLVTEKAVKVLGSIARETDQLKSHTDAGVENFKKSDQTLVKRLIEIRQQHEFLQDNVELFHDFSSALIGCIIPVQIFFIIIESFSIVRSQNLWLSQGRQMYLSSVVLRIVSFTTDLVAIFWAADNLRSHMMEISRAIQKHSFFGLQPDEQFQIQLLSTLSARCRVQINPAGFFSLTRAVIPAIIANVVTFFIIQFQTYTANENSPCNNITVASGN